MQYNFLPNFTEKLTKSVYLEKGDKDILVLFA